MHQSIDYRSTLMISPLTFYGDKRSLETSVVVAVTATI